MTRFGHKSDYAINTFVKRTPVPDQLHLYSTHTRSLPDQRDPYSICCPDQLDRYPIATPSSSRSLLDLTRADSTATRSFKKVVQIWQSLISCYEHEEITSTTSRMSRKGRKARPATAFFDHEATTLSPPPSNFTTPMTPVRPGRSGRVEIE